MMLLALSALLVTAEVHNPSAWTDGPPKLSAKPHAVPRLICLTCVL